MIGFWFASFPDYRRCRGSCDLFLFQGCSSAFVSAIGVVLGDCLTTVFAFIRLDELSVLVMGEVLLVFVLGLAVCVAVGHRAVIGKEGFVTADAVYAVKGSHGSISTRTFWILPFSCL